MRNTRMIIAHHVDISKPMTMAINYYHMAVTEINWIEL